MSECDHIIKFWVHCNHTQHKGEWSKESDTKEIEIKLGDTGYFDFYNKIKYDKTFIIHDPHRHGMTNTEMLFCPKCGKELVVNTYGDKNE